MIKELMLSGIKMNGNGFQFPMMIPMIIILIIVVMIILMIVVIVILMILDLMNRMSKTFILMIMVEAYWILVMRIQVRLLTGYRKLEIY